MNEEDILDHTTEIKENEDVSLASTVPREKVDIYDESFKTLLKDFCHNYQIPFLENNIPKSCKQAAKIYYRLEEDGKAGNMIPQRYNPVV